MIFREYKALCTLRSGAILDLDGILLIADKNQEIRPGDVYVAERNTGPKLLTCERVSQLDGPGNPYVIPTTLEYPYNLNECVKVCPA